MAADGKHHQRQAALLLPGNFSAEWRRVRKMDGTFRYLDGWHLPLSHSSQTRVHPLRRQILGTSVKSETFPQIQQLYRSRFTRKRSLS